MTVTVVVRRGCWSSEQVVGKAGLGTVDEGTDLAGSQDEGGTVRVGGPAEGDLAAGELPGFQAGAAVFAPGLALAIGAEVGGGHAVADGLGVHRRFPGVKMVWPLQDTA